MKILIRFVWLVVIAGLGGPLYAFTVNMLQLSGVLNADAVPTAFGVEMTQKAVTVWIACTALGLISCVMNTRWRYVLLLSPLFAPSLFALIYTLINKTPA